MKKVFVFMLAIMMVFAVIGCGSNSNNNKEAVLNQILQNGLR